MRWRCILFSHPRYRITHFVINKPSESNGSHNTSPRYGQYLTLSMQFRIWEKNIDKKEKRKEKNCSHHCTKKARNVNVRVVSHFFPTRPSAELAKIRRYCANSSTITVL